MYYYLGTLSGIIYVYKTYHQKYTENIMTSIENGATNYNVYLLECSDTSTYVGATVDLQHRLRQHNGEIKGGARATTIKVKQGKQWKRILYITGFPDWKTALQFEWAFKFYSRKFLHCKNPMERRMRGLRQLLSMDKCTSTSLPYAEYGNHGPIIIWESEDAQNLYLSL